MDNLEKLYGIISEIFKIKIEEIKDEIELNDVEQWDSLNLFRLGTEVEEKFNIYISDDDLIKMTSVAKIKEIIKKYGIEL